MRTTMQQPQEQLETLTPAAAANNTSSRPSSAESAADDAIVQPVQADARLTANARIAPESQRPLPMSLQTESDVSTTPAHRVRRFATTLPRPRRKEPTPAPMHCRNCEEPVLLEFCPACGQRNSRDAIHFGDLWRDFVDEFIKWDGKLLRTLCLILFRPGHLTNEYVQGRRVRYFSPFRMYIVVSATFFLLLSRFNLINVNGAAKINQSMPAALGMRVGQRIGEQLTRERTTKKTEGKAQPANHSAKKDTKRNASLTLVGDDEDGTLVFMGKPVNISALPTTVSAYDDQQKGLSTTERDPFLRAIFLRRIIEYNQNPAATARNLITTLLPNLMFVLLPFYALVLKVIYVRQKRYYIEHLIFALHAHTFAFLQGIVILLVGVRFGDDAAAITGGIAVLWASIYNLIGLRRVYKQGWPMTLWKQFHLGNGYVFLMGFAFLLALVLTFLATM